MAYQAGTPQRPQFTSEGSMVPDALIYDGSPVGEPISIPSGTLTRGAVINAGGALANGTGIYGVLAEDVDASGGAVEAVVYIQGHFNENAMDFGSSNAAADKDALRALGILIRAAQAN